MKLEPLRSLLHSLYESWVGGNSRVETDSLNPSVSPEGYVEVSRESVAKELSCTWQDPAVPQRQYEDCVRSAISCYKAGGAYEPFDVLVAILFETVPDLAGMSILEVGCSSGYYFEVFKIKGVQAKYSGCDWSESFIGLARRNHPEVEFQVQDARCLTYADASFDIVISGGCLPCILEYEEAIAETARVARHYVVLHRTPVFYRKKTSYYLRTAYGLQMFEIRFNERELFRLLRKYGLAVVDAVTFEGTYERTSGDFWGCKTYLCRKV